MEDSCTGEATTGDKMTSTNANMNPRQQCEELIHTDAVDKATAIRIYSLYTNMLTDMQHMEVSKTLELEKLKQELAVLTLSQKDRETLLSATTQIASLTTRFSKLEENLNSFSSKLEEMEQELRDHLNGLESRLLSIPTKRR